ncbi:LamG-like jellyroll fold domain-containing protein [Streptomyces cavernae]|uniref:LamG-like jellyroll fold domain-containing protein n=1 Tax=Streptomyces cavernae TaxID=2259034 RepID=UPI000FEB7D74|nr:LamG-like jellyroll fold domain-containing protein [Streptomyces cavernae]
MGTVALASLVAATAWSTGPMLGLAQAAPGEGLDSLVEDFAYPDRDKLLAEKGLKLISGDGNITLAECAAGGSELVRINSRDSGNVCFNASTKKIQLFVNGKAQTAADFTTPWRAAGGLQSRRLGYKGGFQENFAGTVDNVRVWDRAVGVDEIFNDGIRVG